MQIENTYIRQSRRTINGTRITEEAGQVADLFDAAKVISPDSRPYLGIGLWSTLDTHLPEAAFTEPPGSNWHTGSQPATVPLEFCGISSFLGDDPLPHAAAPGSAIPGAGLWTAAMSLWEAQLIQAGHGMVLVSTQSDESAQHFYRKLGYRDCGYLLLDAPGVPAAGGALPLKTASSNDSINATGPIAKFRFCNRP